MIGNANEWVADCYMLGYVGAPADGSAVDTQNCPQRSLRGAGWTSNPALSTSAARAAAPPAARLNAYGFRVARDL
jgi:formylglycine-generating enzyme required for sulfatase activity